MNLSFNKIQRDLGIELLRVCLCFWIVLVHCLSSSTLTDIVQRNNYHVPCFIFISFYFYYRTLIRKDINNIKNRCIRLLIPFWTWPLIIFVINNLCFLLISRNRFNRFITYNELKIQLLFGRSFHAQLWFLFNLLLFNLFFFIIAFIFKKNFLFLLQLFAIIIYILQYSGMSLKFFENYNDCIKYSIGHCLATYPISIISLSFSSINVISQLKCHTFKTIFLSIAIIYISLKYNIFSIVYGYYGFKKALISFLLFIIFASLSLEKCQSHILKMIIKRMTQYTQGIFCLHNIIRFYLIKLFEIKKICFKECIVIYIISYFICFVGTKLFINSNFKYLFN